MPHALRTSTTSVLLDGLLNSENEEVWEEFDDRYRPILVGFAMRMGLAAVDAEEMAQETLVQFLQDYQRGKYDRERGRLRSWIMTISRNRISDHFRRGGQRREQRGESAMGALSETDKLSRIWEEEHEREILRRAMHTLRVESEFRETTLDVFERLILKGQSADEIAAPMELPVHAVYRAKHRCLGRLSALVEEIRGRYEDL